MDIKRFSTPDPHGGDPLPFVVEVVRVRREVTAADDGPGQVVEHHDRDEVWFGARPDVSGGVLLQVESMGGIRTRARRNVRGTDALMDFYDAALIPLDREVQIDGQPRTLHGIVDFRAIVDDPDAFVQLDTLIDVGTWLYENYTADRPTRQPRT